MPRFELHKASGYKLWDNEKKEYWWLSFDWFEENEKKAIDYCSRLNKLNDSAIELVKNNYSWLRGRSWKCRQ